MAFRRKTVARRKTRGFETRAHANRAFKRVTRQWELSFNIKCQIVSASKGPDCPNGGVIKVMTNAQLHGSAAFPANANFPDAVRIRRLEGNLYFRPTQILNDVAPTGQPVEDCFNSIAEQYRTTYMRAGLRKLPGPESQAGVPDALNPLNNGATAEEISDYADGRWSKMWEHVWDARPFGLATLGNNFNCCSTQAGYNVVIASGEADYAVPPIVCQPCGDVENPAVDLGCQTGVNLPSWWHMRVRYGRTIVMKEADDLSIYFGWERMRETTDAARLAQPDMEFFGGLRMLLES